MDSPCEKHISDYEILEKVGDTARSVVYKARKVGTKHTVIIKMLTARYPSPAETARFKHEYEIIRSIDTEGVIKVFDIIDSFDGVALVLEDFGGVSLRQLIPAGFSLVRFLDLAVRISEILGILHQKSVTHRDIKPNSILLNQDADILKLADFGIASEFTRQNEEIYNPVVLEGALAYISPEQTGRMNRSVDYRTDLYSLGVTFYEMLTGHVPFMSHDPMEIIHSHIAKRPARVHTLNPDIPLPVSDIVFKLMAKSAEERYQNSFGLMADLKTCLDGIHADGRIEPFPLGLRDISLRFNIPQILVGRDAEIGTLLAGFDRASQGTTELLLVSGDPGIGKSALVNEIYKPIVEKRGYFISGKYDQFRKDVPYSAIIQAFMGLIKQMLSESDTRIASWRKMLLDALGPNGKVIAEVIPDLEHIIGTQPTVETLRPEEAQNRFNLAFQSFVNVFTTAEHPLAIFLDDLQWADPASLKLVKTILTGSSKHLFLIGAYRRNEVSLHHPVSITIDEMEKKGRTINRIQIGPLKPADVNTTIMNVLRCKAEESAELAELIHEKTGGNPFFVNQFLKNLYDSRTIEVDPKTGWSWDMDKIRQMQFTDNVVEFMAGKISSMPKCVLETLKVCSCIGNRFDLETLATACEKTIDAMLTDLTVVIQENLVCLQGALYRFHHDRIQEAAYSLIPEAEKSRLHYLIGKIALDKTPEEHVSEKIFYIVDQLNRGVDLATDTDERIRLAGLNLKAAEKAKSSTAYSSALRYAGTGIRLLPQAAWDEHYELTYALHNEMFECEYLTGELAQAEKTFHLIVKNAKSNLDRANVHTQMIILKQSTGGYASALEIGFAGLKMTRMPLPRKASKLRLGIELLKLRLHFWNKRIEDLADLPFMTDKEVRSSSYLSINTGTVAYFLDLNLFSFIVTRGINTALKHGNFELSPFAYSAMGSLLGGGLGLYEQGYLFGKTSLKLYEKMGGIKNRSKILFLFAFFILHWKEHARNGLDYVREAYKAGLQAGDLIYSGYSINVLAMHRMILGHNLDKILEEYLPYQEFQMNARDPFTPRNYRENLQMIRCLKGPTPTMGSLTGDGFDEEEQIEAYIASGNMLGQIYTLTSMLRVRWLFGRHDGCGAICRKILKLIQKKAGVGTLHIPEFYFYYSLHLAVMEKKAGFRRKLAYRTRLILNQLKMKRWAKSCPANFEHKYLLVEAELARMRGKNERAARLYDKAIQLASDNGYMQNEAIANELASEFYLSRGFEKIARTYLEGAYQCYRTWGATGKVEELEKAHPLLKVSKARTGPMDTVHAASVTSAANMTSSILDIGSVMKVSQAISGEIVLDRLIRTIMKMAVENAGAHKGFFILNTDGKLTIEAAEKDGDEGAWSHMQSVPLETCDDLSKPIVQYVYRSGEDVILGDAAQEGAFTNDDYIRQTRCKSILCTPIMHKGILLGILYMENNLTTNAFTPERMELLRIFASQAAISLENARLFELATTDGLTKLYVHRYFQLLLDQEFQRSHRYNKRFALLMIDIDNFKKFNDTYGHQLGDEVLRSVARTIRKTSRDCDTAARYGGEEMAIILPETNARDAMAAAERIRAAVASTEVPHLEEKLRVTISIGVAEFPTHAQGKKDLIRRADEAMYDAKRTGKNRVMLYQG
jgi:diguanylate cyclase (GGDEF)-like protein